MKAVFFDRDGVINNNSKHYYIYKKEQWEFNADIEKAMLHFIGLGYELFIITNQGGIARGCYSKEEVDHLHDTVTNILAKKGIIIKEIAICPHHNLLEHCLCRKPKPLMLEKLIAKYGIDTESSWLIGDSKTDCEAAQAAGVKSILIESNSNIYEQVKQIT